MKALFILFLLAGTAAPAFSEITANLSHDTIVPVPKYQPSNKMPAGGYLKKLPKNPASAFPNPPVDPYAKKSDSIIFLAAVQSRAKTITDEQ
jgi:hypothetical protein